jgi:hypothetical protein
VKQQRVIQQLDEQELGGALEGPELDEEQRWGNGAAASSVGAAGQPEPPPSLLDEVARPGAPAGPPAGPPAGGGEPLPFRAEMEAAFGQDFGSVQVQLGVSSLGALGAHAATAGERVLFASARPDRQTVAHELTHVVQARRGQPDQVRARSAVGAPSGAAEVEAEAVGARVASGRSAGAIGAAPGAPVQREAKAAAPQPVSKVLRGEKLQVWPDAAYLALIQVAPAQPAGTLSESMYRQRVQAFGQELVTKLVELHGLDPVSWYRRGKEEVARLIQQAEPDVRVAAFGLLSQDPAVLADLKLAQELAAGLDPVFELRRVLEAGGDSQGILRWIEGWARGYGPETCRRALADGDIQVRLNLALGTGPSVKARLLLIGAGTIEESPRNRMFLSLYEKDAGAFGEAWGALKLAEPALVTRYLGDATFLEDVRAWVPDAYASVLQDVRSFSPEAPAAAVAPAQGADALNAEARRNRLLARVAPLAQQLQGSITSTGAFDNPYLDPTPADPVFAQAAQRVYEMRRAVVVEEGLDVSTAEGASAAVAAEKQALELLRPLLNLPGLALYGTAAGRTPFFRALETADHEVGKRLMRETGQTSLTPEEQAAITAVAERYATQLAALHRDGDDPDREARRLLEQFGREAGALVRPSAGGSQQQEWARSERQRRAQELLDQVFVARTGRSLSSHVGSLVGAWGDRSVLHDYLLARTERDIEDDPDAYTDQLTALDQKRLRSVFSVYSDDLGPLVQKSGTRVAPGADAPEGMQIAGEFPALTYRLRRDHVARELGSLEARVRTLLQPSRQEGPFLAAWERKIRAAMDQFEQELEASHGSLRKAIDDGTGEAEDKQSALSLLGERDDGTFALQQQILGKIAGDASGAHAFLLELAPAIQSAAAALGEALAPAMKPEPPLPITPSEALARHLQASVEEQVSDMRVMLQAQRVRGYMMLYPQKVPGGDPQDVTRMLVAAFARVGGSLPPLVVKGLSRDNADQALSWMGLQHAGLGGTQTADLAAVASGQQLPVRQESDEVFQGRLESRAASFSGKLSSLKGEAGTPERIQRLMALATEARQLVALASLADGGLQRLHKLWQDRLGISLGADLGRHLEGDSERNLMAAAFRLPAAEITAPPDPLRQVRELASDPNNVADPFAFLREAGVRPDEVDPDFSLLAACQRAVALYYALGRLPGSHREVMDLVSKRPGEMKVVGRVFQRLYGFDPRYRLQQAFPGDFQRIEEYAGLVQTAGKGSPGRPLLAYARTGDNKEVLRQALRLSASERSAVLADHASLGELRVRLGGDYERLYDTLSGKYTLYDVVRSDKDVGAHIEEFFEGRRRTLSEDTALRAQAGGDEQKLEALVNARLRQEGRQAYSDPALQKLLDERFGESKDFEVRARLLGGGKLTSLDQATKAVITDGDTDEAALRGGFESMDAEQRERVRNDPFFQRRVASDLEEMDGDIKDSRRVFAELYAEKGANGLAKLEEHRNHLKLWNTPEYDPGKSMEAVLGMSQAELAALRASPDDLHRLRASLDEGRRKRLDAYLASAQTVAAPAQTGQFLVERYVARFLEHRDSTKKALGVAQECFSEKGMVPGGPGQPERSTFGAAERHKVWARVEGELDLAVSAHLAVHGALVLGQDPTAFRLQLAFQGEDNQAEILASIDNAGADTVIRWSNVLEDGPVQGYGSLKEKFDAWLAAERALAATPDSGAEEAYQFARNRFLDHRLDLSRSSLEYLSGGGGDKVTLYGFAGQNLQVKDEPSKKRLLEMKEHVRKRVWGLSADEVAAKVGLVAPESARDEQDKERFEAEKKQYDQRKAMLVSEDRITRSEFQHRSDVYSHQRGSGSGSGAETEGSRVDVAFQGYRSELAQGLGDSELSGAEIQRVKLAGGDFDRKVQEYKEAKARLSSILKMIAQALIIAVATVLTGGAGGVLATLIIAGTSAMADNVIDSIVLGNDFDWEEDGVKHLLTEMGTAAFTLGMGKAFKAVQAPLGISGKMQKVAALEARLAEGATSSFRGMALNYAYQSGKSAVMAPLNAVSEATIEMLDPSEWKYGWEDYSSFAGEVFQSKMEAMPDALRGELLDNLASGLVGLGRGKLGRKGPTLPGAPSAASPTPRSRSLTKAAAHYLGTEALGDAVAGLTDEGLKLLARKIASGGADGLSFSEEEVEDFLIGLAARGGKAVAGAAGQQRRNNAVADRVEKEKAGFGEDSEGLAHYEAHLQGADMGLFGGLSADAGKFRQQLSRKREELKARAQGQKLGAQYERWVLGAPGELERRMATDYADFEARYEAGLARLQQIRESEAYKRLSAEERRWFERSAADTDLVLGATSKRSLLSLEGEGEARFQEAARNTAVATVSAHVGELLTSWDSTKRRAWEAHLQELGVDKLRHATSEDDESAKVHAARLAVAFDKQYELEAAKRAQGKSYVGDAPEVSVPQLRSASPRSGADSVTGEMAAVKPPPGFEVDHLTMDRREAMSEYRRWVDGDDRLEVAVWYDWETGEFAVVRGLEDRVWRPQKPGRWAIIEHWHPPLADPENMPLSRFPSGRKADMSVLEDQARATGEIAMSAISSEQPWGRSRTLYGFDPHANSGRGEWFVDYAVGPDDGGKEKRHRRTFLDLDEYETFLEVRRGELPDPAHGPIRTGASRPPAAGASEPQDEQGGMSAPHKKRAAQDGPLSRLPSEGEAEALERRARKKQQVETGTFTSRQPWGTSRTSYGYDPKTGEWFVDYATGWDDYAGVEKRFRRTFRAMSDYQTFLSVRTEEEPFQPRMRGQRAELAGSQQQIPLSALDPADTARIQELAQVRQGLRDRERRTGVQGTAVHDPQTGHVHDEASRTWTRDMGETAARAYMRMSFPSFEELPQDLVEGARTFDLIFIDRTTRQIVVVEAKGGSAEPGARRDGTEQGSPRYAKEIIGEYLTRLGKRDLTDEYGEMVQLLQRAWEGDRLRYLLVSQPVDAAGQPSALSVSEYDVSRAHRYRKP